MNQPKFSCLIVTWNNQQIIAECIQTLFQYCPADTQVVVVDNDSQDETCRVIRETFGDRVVLVEAGDNLGFSKANNLALQHATGDYIFYCNPDVVFTEDVLTPLVQVLETQPEVGVVSPMLVYPDGSYQISTDNFPSASRVFWDDMHMFRLLPASKRYRHAQSQNRKPGNRFVDWTYGAAQLCRREDVEAVGGYPEDYFLYGEDTAFCHNILAKTGKKTYYLSDCSLIHLGGYSEKQVLTGKKPTRVANAGMYFVGSAFGKAALLRYRFLLLGASWFKFVAYSCKRLIKSNQHIKNSQTKWDATCKAVLTYKNDRQ